MAACDKCGTSSPLSHSLSDGVPTPGAVVTAAPATAVTAAPHLCRARMVVLLLVGKKDNTCFPASPRGVVSLTLLKEVSPTPRCLPVVEPALIILAWTLLLLTIFLFPMPLLVFGLQHEVGLPYQHNFS